MKAPSNTTSASNSEETLDQIEANKIVVELLEKGFEDTHSKMRHDAARIISFLGSQKITETSLKLDWYIFEKMSPETKFSTANFSPSNVYLFLKDTMRGDKGPDYSGSSIYGLSEQTHQIILNRIKAGENFLKFKPEEQAKVIGWVGPCDEKFEKQIEKIEENVGQFKTVEREFSDFISKYREPIKKELEEREKDPQGTITLLPVEQLWKKGGQTGLDIFMAGYKAPTDLPSVTNDKIEPSPPEGIKKEICGNGVGAPTKTCG